MFFDLDSLIWNKNMLCLMSLCCCLLIDGLSVLKNECFVVGKKKWCLDCVKNRKVDFNCEIGLYLNLFFKFDK